MYQKSDKKTIVTYNTQGEADKFEDVQEIIKIEKRHFRKGEFFQMTFKLLEILEDFKGADYKVLKTLLQRLEFNNRIRPFNQTILAAETGISQQQVSKSLKTLEGKKIIYKDGLVWYFSDIFIKYAGDKKQKKESEENE